MKTFDLSMNRDTRDLLGGGGGGGRGRLVKVLVKWCSWLAVLLICFFVGYLLFGPSLPKNGISTNSNLPNDEFAVIYDNGSPPEAGIDPNPNAKAEAEKEDSTRVRVGTSTTTTVPIPTTAQGQGSDANEASTNTTLHFADLLEKELYSVDGTASTNNATANGESPIPGAMTIQEDRRAEVTGNGSTSAQNLDLGTG
jgi:hypothetical protein